MRRLLTPTDFPLTVTGTAIFSAFDPRPLFVCADVETAELLHCVLTVGWCAIIDTMDLALNAPHEPDEAVTKLTELGQRVLRVVKGLGHTENETPPDPQLDLGEPQGWTLDPTAKRR